MVVLGRVTPEQEDQLRGLSEQDQTTIETLTKVQIRNTELSGLDPRTHSLCSMAALISIDAPLASYAWQAAVAIESGVTVDDIVGVLVTLAPTVGMARIVAAANKLSIVHDVAVEELWKAA